MAMTKLKVENFGPIKSVDVSLGDLNILIGRNHLLLHIAR